MLTINLTKKHLIVIFVAIILAAAIPAIAQYCVQQQQPLPAGVIAGFCSWHYTGAGGSFMLLDSGAPATCAHGLVMTCPTGYTKREFSTVDIAAYNSHITNVCTKN
jgi:hypothetical protein